MRKLLFLYNTIYIAICQISARHFPFQNISKQMMDL